MASMKLKWQNLPHIPFFLNNGVLILKKVFKLVQGVGFEPSSLWRCHPHFLFFSFPENSFKKE
jgi:hypothetical protein